MTSPSPFWAGALLGILSAPVLYFLCLLAAHFLEEWIRDREQAARSVRSRAVDEYFSRPGGDA